MVGTLQAVRSRFTSRAAVLIDGVKGAWIVAEYFVDDSRADLSLRSQLAQRFNLAGVICMAVIGADDKIILAGITEDVLEIIVGLAGDIYSLILQNPRA